VPSPEDLPWSFSGEIGSFLDAGDDGNVFASVGDRLAALLPPSVTAFLRGQLGVAATLPAVASKIFGTGPRQVGPGSPDTPPSQPAPAPDRPAPTQAPGGATAGTGFAGGGFSAALFAGLLAFMGLAALRMGPLVMASARLRPQAYIALLERPG
jgi:hypothetical protein